MVPGIDFRAFGYNARERAHAVYHALARRYARLALEAAKRGQPVSRVGTSARRSREEGSGSASHLAPRSFAGLAEPEQSHRTRADIRREATLQQRARLAELFTVANARAGGVAFAVKLLDEGLKTRQIASVLQTLPDASQRGGSSGFATRLAARDALAPPPTASSAPSDRVAALKAAYAKATGDQI